MAWPKGIKRSADSVAKGIHTAAQMRTRRSLLERQEIIMQNIPLAEIPHIPSMTNPREYYSELYGMVGGAEKSCSKVVTQVLKKNLYPKPSEYKSEARGLFNPAINKETEALAPQSLLDEPDQKNHTEDDTDAE